MKINLFNFIPRGYIFYDRYIKSENMNIYTDDYVMGFNQKKLLLKNKEEKWNPMEEISTIREENMRYKHETINTTY